MNKDKKDILSVVANILKLSKIEVDVADSTIKYTGDRDRVVAILKRMGFKEDSRLVMAKGKCIVYLTDYILNNSILFILGSLGDTDDSLNFSGLLDLKYCSSIESLPKKLNLSGGLYLDGCGNLKNLPLEINVGGNLSLDQCSSLTTLPDKLYVNGDLRLRGTGIKSIPKSAKIIGRVLRK